MSKPTQHVIPSLKGGWAVRARDAQRASKVFPTQLEAIRHARAIAKRDRSALYIHKRNGCVRERENYGLDLLPLRKGV